jgi:hypothetical protein
MELLPQPKNHLMMASLNLIKEKRLFKFWATMP